MKKNVTRLARRYRKLTLSKGPKIADEFLKSEAQLYLTESELEIFVKAHDHKDIDACKLLLHASPESLYFPFMVEALIGIIKSISKSRLSRSKATELICLWSELIPDRSDLGINRFSKMFSFIELALNAGRTATILIPAKRIQEELNLMGKERLENNPSRSNDSYNFLNKT